MPNLGYLMTEGIDYNSYSNIKRLSDAELEELWNNYFKDRTSKRLRDQLIVQYIYLAKYVVGRVKVTLPTTFSLEDITSYGIEGLINAVEKYSFQKGARFETYALMRIRGTIIDKIRSQDFVPRSARKRIKDVKIVIERLKQQLGRVPTSTEVGNVMGISPEKVDEILAEETTLVSLYEKKNSGEESLEIIDTVEDEKIATPAEELEQKDTKKELEQALKRLPERERMIMVLYYHQNMTLKEIAEMLELSESRVCQLHAQAIMKLKNILTTTKTNRLQRSIV
ncbi:FliA/WhiG family RNA polymerase sigma factor [bacterium]|nr:FliA/WhiG family RNA polymerase sigma factor [bacterium]